MQSVLNSLLIFSIFCKSCHPHPWHIYEKLIHDDGHMTAVLQYLLRISSGANRLAVIRITNADFDKPVKESDSILSRDVIVPRGRYVVCNFQYRTFIQTYANTIFTPDIFRKCDFLFLIDNLDDVVVGIPAVIKHEERISVYATRAQNSSGILTANEPRKITLTDYENLIFIESSRNNDCGIVTANSIVRYWNKAEMKLFERPIQPLETYPSQNNESHQYNNKYTCIVGVLFHALLLQDGDDKLQQYVFSHPIHQIMSLLLFTRNTRLITVIRTPENGFIYKDYVDLTYSRFFYVDMYWYGFGHISFQNLPPETLICLGSEKIVWIVVNPAVRVFNWNLAVSVAALATGILIISFVIEHSSGYKFPFQLTVLSMWSIFLSVSIPTQPRQYVNRIIFFSWTLSSSVLTLCYYYKLFEALSNPSVANYRNNADVLRTDIIILSYLDQYITLATNLRFNYNKTIYLKGDFFTSLKHYAEAGTEFALLIDYKHIERFVPKLYGAPYYVVPTEVTTYPNCIYSSYADKLTAYIRKKAAQLDAAGIVDKVMKRRPRNEEFTTSSVIDLKYLWNIYILVGVLYLMAFIIFIGEKVMFKWNKNLKNVTSYNVGINNTGRQRDLQKKRQISSCPGMGYDLPRRLEKPTSAPMS